MSEALNVGTLRGTIELEDKFSSTVSNLVGAQLGRASAGIAALGDQVSVLGARLQSTGRFVSSAGDRLSFLAIPLTLATKAVADLSVSFDKNMTKVVNIAGVTEEAMAGFRKEVLRMGPDLAKGPIELSEALYAIASVGVRDATNAMAVLERSAKASTVGLGETEDVARAVVAAMVAYGKENMSAAQATDQLLAAVREGGAEADQFANTLGRVIGSAKEVGISFAETLASVATFTRVGVRADEAVTALRGTIAFLMKPSAGARDMLKELGTSIEEVRNKVKQDGLADALIELVRLTQGNDDALGKIIPNVRALAGVLANTGEQASAYKDILREVTNSQGDLDEAFTRTSQTAAFKFQQLQAQLQVLMVGLGESLVPALLSAAQALTPIFNGLAQLVGAFNLLPGPIKTVTLAFLGLTLISGPLMSFGGRLLEVWGMMMGPKGLGGLITFINSYTQAVRANTAVIEVNTVAQAVNAATTTTTVVATAAAGSKALTGLSLAAAKTRLELQSTALVLGSTGQASILAAERGFRPLQQQLLLTGEAAGTTLLGRLGLLLRTLVSWPVTLAAVSAALVLGTDGLKSLGSIAVSTASIIGSFARDTLSLLVRAIEGAVAAGLRFAGWLGDMIPLVGSLRSGLEKAAEGFRMVADEAAQGNWMPLAISLQTSNPLLAKFLELLTASNAQAREFKLSGDLFNQSFAPQNMSKAGGMSVVPFGEQIFDDSDRIKLGAASATEQLNNLVESAKKARELGLKPLNEDMKRTVLLLSEFGGPKGSKMTAEQVAAAIPKEFGINEAQVRKLLETNKELTKDYEKQQRAVELLERSLVPLTQVEERLIETWTAKGASAAEVARAFDLNVIAVERYSQTVQNERDQIDRFFKDTFEQAWQRMDEDLERQDDWVRGIIQVQQDLENQLELFHLTGRDRVVRELEIEKDAFKKSLIARGFLIAEIDALVEEHYGNLTRMATGSADTIVQRMKQAGVETEKAMREMAEQAIFDFIAMGKSGEFTAQQLDAQWRLVLDLFDELTGRTEELKYLFQALEGLAGGLNTLGDAIAGIEGDHAKMIASMVSGLGKLVDAWRQAIEIAERYRRGEVTRGEQIGTVLGGIGSVIGATNTGTTQQRAISGAFAGAGAGLAIGASFGAGAGPIGAAIGAIAGLTLGLIRGGMALTEYQKRVRQAAVDLQKLRVDATEAAGGIQRLVSMASIVGIELGKAWNTKDPEFLKQVLADVERKFGDLKAAMEEFNIGLEDLGKEAKELFITDAAQGLYDKYFALIQAGVTTERATGGMSTALNDFITQTLRAGTGIPEALRPMVEQLIRMGLITENNARLMLGLAEESIPSLNEIEAAAKRYGKTLDDMGPKVQQLRLNEVAAQLTKDFKLFTDIGLNMDAIIDMMGKDIQDLVVKALRGGLELPKSMKPLVEAMLAAGLLVDETGEKMTGLGRLKWTEPLSEAIDRLILKLDELINKFLSVGRTEVPPIEIPYRVRRQGPPGPGGGEGPPSQDGFPSPDFIPQSFGVGEFDTARGFTSQTIIVEVDREVIAKANAKGAPSLLKVRTGR